MASSAFLGSKLPGQQRKPRWGRTSWILKPCLLLSHSLLSEGFLGRSRILSLPLSVDQLSPSAFRYLCLQVSQISGLGTWHRSTPKTPQTLSNRDNKALSRDILGGASPHRRLSVVHAWVPHSEVCDYCQVNRASSACGGNRRYISESARVAWALS